MENAEAIVKWAYDRIKGNWVYYSIEKNREKPDSVSDMLIVLETIAENIRKEDLIRYFTPRNRRSNEKKEIIYESPNGSGIKRSIRFSVQDFEIDFFLIQKVHFHVLKN